MDVNQTVFFDSIIYIAPSLKFLSCAVWVGNYIHSPICRETEVRGTFSVSCHVDHVAEALLMFVCTPHPSHPFKAFHLTVYKIDRAI